MKNVYGYTRVSTAKQGEGVSLDAQRESIQAYAEQHQLNIIEWFEEKETAAKHGRPLFSKMISQLKAKKTDGVIMHKIDRSARNLRDWAAIGELMDSGIEVHFSFESIDCDTRGGRLSADIQAVIAADYIRNLRMETQKGIYGRLKQGIWPLPAPIGYLDTGSGLPKVLDPDRSMLIKKMFELYSTGNYSVRSLAQKMNSLGLTNKSGNRITKITICTTLRNPYYYGVLKVKKTGQTFVGKHKPLISKKLFDQVQDVLDGKTSRKKKRHTFLFSRAIRCLNCKYSLIAEKQKGHTYYRCQTRACPTRSVREDKILKEFFLFLKSVSLPSSVTSQVKERFQELRLNKNAVQKHTEDSLRLQIAKLESRNQTLLDALLDGLITKSDFEVKKKEINEQTVELKRRVSVSARKSCQIRESIEEFLELTKSLGNIDEKTKNEKIFSLVKKVSSNLFLDRKKLVLEAHPSYFALLNLEGVLLSCLCRDRPPENNLICLECSSKSHQNRSKKNQSDAIVKSIINSSLEG